MVNQVAFLVTLPLFFFSFTLIDCSKQIEIVEMYLKDRAINLFKKLRKFSIYTLIC